MPGPFHPNINPSTEDPQAVKEVANLLGKELVCAKRRIFELERQVCDICLGHCRTGIYLATSCVTAGTRYHKPGPRGTLREPLWLHQSFRRKLININERNLG